MPEFVLTIAGSDPSGGAGIQADLRTFEALGVRGASAITAITVQSSRGVSRVEPVAPDLLTQQIDALLADGSFDAIKIGMLGGAEQVQAVADVLRKHDARNVVLDPVLVSSSGARLLSIEGVEVLKRSLLPMATLVTPNIDELAELTGMPVRSYADRIAAARSLVGQSGVAVLVKGGHLGPHEEAEDVLITTDSSMFRFPGARVGTPHTHGTGCFLSAAIAALLAQARPLPDAVARAKGAITQALAHPVVRASEKGYPALPLPASFENPGQLRSLMKGVYFVTDPDIRPDRSSEEMIAAAIAGGVRIVQLREKQMPLARLVETATRLSVDARKTKTTFIVNDRVDVALASGADGVHLGPDDMPPAAARRIAGDGLIIGVSVGNLDEARAAASFASYFGVGAIFGSKTKSDAGAPVGLETIRAIRAEFPSMPIAAIGGIDRTNIRSVLDAGADAAAVVSAIAAAADMTAAARELVQLAKESHPEAHAQRNPAAVRIVAPKDR